MNINQSFLVLLISAAVLNGTPLLFGTVGEILSEKSGNLNLGVEGMMYMGGAMGLGGAFYYEMMTGGNTNGLVAVLIAILFAFLGGAFGALIYSFITITLRANQNVTGLALAIFGTGAGQFIGEYMRVTSGGYVAISNELKAVFQGSPFPAALQSIPSAGGGGESRHRRRCRNQRHKVQVPVHCDRRWDFGHRRHGLYYDHRRLRLEP